MFWVVSGSRTKAPGPPSHASKIKGAPRQSPPAQSGMTASPDIPQRVVPAAHNTRHDRGARMETQSDAHGSGAEICCYNETSLR